MLTKCAGHGQRGCMLKILLLAFALGLDAFSVSFSAGICNLGVKDALILSLSFGFFQFIMPLLGVFFGRFLGAFITGWAPCLVAFIFITLGIVIIYKGNKKGGKKLSCANFMGLNVLYLSIGTSLDAFSSGIALGLMDQKVLFPSVVIGITAFIMSHAGILLGRNIRSHLEKWSDEIAGGILILVGIAILLKM